MEKNQESTNVGQLMEYVNGLSTIFINLRGVPHAIDFGKLSVRFRRKLTLLCTEELKILALALNEQPPADGEC